MAYEHLPGPDPDTLVLYVLGPGFGESVVIGAPTGEWIVVDCCRKDGRCLPLELLRERGVSDVALVVLTHADLDHLDGIAEVLAAFSVHRVLRFPVASSLPSLLALALRRAETDRRLLALHTALEAVRQLEDRNLGFDAIYSTSPRVVGEATVTPITPVPAELVAARRQIQAMIDAQQLSEPVRAWLTGESRRVPGAWNNGLSVTLALEWSGHRVLLPADLEVAEGANAENRGWQGLLSVLKRDGLLHLVRDLRVVKVAHHGSDGAWHQPAWDLHGAVGVAAITPWNRGRSGLPSEVVLQRLTGHAATLALTQEEPRATARRAPHWPHAAVAAAPGEPAVAITLHRSGDVAVHTTGTASAWRP